MSEIATLVEMAQDGGIVRVYAAGSVPSSPKYPYAVIASARMAPDVRRLDGGGNNPRRFTGQVFAQTAEGAEALADLLLETFDCTFMPFDEEPQCRVEVTTPPYRDPDDDGVLNITQTFRY